MTQTHISPKSRYWWLPVAFAIAVPVFLVIYTRVLNQRELDFELHGDAVASHPCAMLLLATQGFAEILLSIPIVFLGILTQGVTGRMLITVLVSIIILCAGLEIGIRYDSSVVYCRPAGDSNE